jgi:hypothetical protein
MLRIFLASFFLAAFPLPLFAASPDPQTLVIAPSELSRSRELVHQLGSEEYSEREEAEQALAKMGRLARPALLEGVNEDPSPEVRNRCAALLPKATSLEMKARLEVFLADVDGKYDHDLPGWKHFRAVVCDDWNLFGHHVLTDPSLEKAARSVFVELIANTDNKTVVMATSASKTELNAIVLSRRAELSNQRLGRNVMAPGFAEPTMRRQIMADDIAALLFAESFSAQSTARVPRVVQITNLFISSGFSSQVQETDDKGKVYKAILASWMQTRINPLDLFWSMSQAPRLGLSNLTNSIAVRLLNSPGAPPTHRAQAAMTLANSGGKEQIRFLEKAFEDTTVVSSVGVRNIRVNGAIATEGQEIQIRDLALAVAIQLAGEKPEDYGFVDQVGVSAYNRYYIPENNRSAAFEKWKGKKRD